MAQILIDSILEKISTHGINALSYDERVFLNQNNTNTIDKNLEIWLTCEDEDTFDANGRKLQFSEFEEGEELLEIREKLKRVISNFLNIKPFTNNSDWGSGHVWRIKSDDNFTGDFIYLGDDELVFLNRIIDENEEYVDTTLIVINDVKTLYSLFLKINRNESINNR